MTQQKRLERSLGGAWLWRMVALLLIVALLLSGGVIGAAGPPEFEAAPQQPRAAAEVSSRTGFIPPPMDLSHLTAQELPRGYEAAVLPAEFDWRDSGKVTPVRDQGNCGSCYAFGYLGNVESRMLIDGAGTYNFSENNAKECNWKELNNFQYPPGNPWGSCDGGNAHMMSNLFSQKGTVLESCDPYVDSDVSCKSSCAYNKTLLDWRLISGRSIPSTSVLKQYLYDNGPIITSMYADVAEFYAYNGSYTLNYAGPGDMTDHCVLIVGWSNNLPPVPGGSSPASGWIVKNSWGTGWGDNGYFYIAYGAANIGMWSSYSYGWQNYDTSGGIMFYDEDGWWDSVGETSGTYMTAWALAKFIPTSNTNVTRVEFWTTDTTTDVDVYLWDDFNGTTLSNQLASKLNNSFSEAGYHSVQLDSPVAVTSGDDVVAVVKFTNASFGYPVAVDANGPIETGRTYISLTGGNGSWTDLGSALNWDAAIRVRTSTGPVSPAPTVTSITPNSGINNGTVHITNLAGSNFQSGATVKLTKSGQPDIPGTGVSVVSPSKITCDFNLNGAATGAWNVVVTNPDAQSGALSGGFTVQPASGQKYSAYLPMILNTLPGEVTTRLYSTADATAIEALPSTNFGDTTDMWVGFDHCMSPMGRIARSFVRFDTGSIPSGATVVDATLYLYLANSCDIGERVHNVTVYRATAGWAESTLNWNNQPGHAEAYDSRSIPSRTWDWYPFDVTGLVQGWVSGSFSNHGLVARSNESSGNDSARLGFYTRENNGTTVDPYIEVTYMGTPASQGAWPDEAVGQAPTVCGPTVGDVLGASPGRADLEGLGFTEQSACQPD